MHPFIRSLSRSLGKSQYLAFSQWLLFFVFQFVNRFFWGGSWGFIVHAMAYVDQRMYVSTLRLVIASLATPRSIRSSQKSMLAFLHDNSFSRVGQITARVFTYLANAKLYVDQLIYAASTGQGSHFVVLEGLKTYRTHLSDPYKFDEI